MQCTGQQAADSSHNEQEDIDSLSILDGADYAATAIDVAEPTLEQFADDDAASDSTAEALDEAYAVSQPMDAAIGGNVAADDDAAQLWSRAQRYLSWLMGCTHGAVLMRSQQQLLVPAQLQVTGSSEAMPAAIEGPSSLLQRLSSARPLKVTMLLSSTLPGQSAEPQGQDWPGVASLAQQEPLMMQKDGIIRPQKLANLLQSLSSAQAASRMLPAEGAATIQPQVLASQRRGSLQPRQIAETLQQLPWIAFGDHLSSQPADGQAQVASSEMQGPEQPQSLAAVLQQLPWTLFGKQLRGEMSARLLQTEPAPSQEADIAAPTARAAIPGQNGATVVLTNALPFGQALMDQVSHLPRSIPMILPRASFCRAPHTVWISSLFGLLFGVLRRAPSQNAQVKC